MSALQVRVIADAKVKTDRIDAAVLARLHAAGYLPEVWQPDEATEFLRRQVARRAGIVKGMTRTKNRIHAVLHANLIPPYQGKLFMAPGRKWLGEQPLAEDERAAVDQVGSRHSTAWSRSWLTPNGHSPRLASEMSALGGS